VATFVPLIIMAFWIGLYPKPFLQILEQPVKNTMAMVHPDDHAPAAVNADLGAPLLPAGKSGNATMKPEPKQAPAAASTHVNTPAAATKKGNN